MKIILAKPTYDVLDTLEPNEIIFSSNYGTLKYYSKTSAQAYLDAADGDISCRVDVEHNLDKYLFTEVYVRVYIGTPSGNYEYCPFFGSGATIQYDAFYSITKDSIELYGNINGFSLSTWTFDFVVFLFTKNLGL
jgi:hypothetical protein